jgi:hypothetical protein
MEEFIAVGWAPESVDSRKGDLRFLCVILSAVQGRQPPHFCISTGGTDFYTFSVKSETGGRILR